MTTFVSSRPTLAPDVALRGALPELKAAELRLRQNAAQHGIRYVIAEFGGLRTQSDTTDALAYRKADYAVYVRHMQAVGQTPESIDVFRPIRPFGLSFHNYGAAFDVFVVEVPDGRTQAWGLAMLQNAMPVVGLRSGKSFGDPPHAELAVTLAEAKAKWEGLTGSSEPTTTNGSTTVAALLGVVALGALVLYAWQHRGAL